MCPMGSPPSVAEIGEYWTDEELCLNLVKYKSGSPLPRNVTSDVNPYLLRPSNLPGLWYFCSGVEKDGEHGLWRATGEACEIFSNSTVVCSRTTLNYYEGRAPHEQKTNWVMQEYRTTEKCNKKQKDPRVLCRVFLADANMLAHPELPSRDSIADIDVKNSFDLVSKTDTNGNSSGQMSRSELLEKNMDNGRGPSAVADGSPEPPVEKFPDINYILRGDYLELNDLIDPGSRSSSSADSSCLTMTSEEYFDSEALLRELEDESKDQEMKDSNVKFNLSSSVKSKEVVLRPASVGSVGTGEESKPATEEASNLDVRNQQEDHGNGSASRDCNTTSSPSTSEGSSKGEKKDRDGRTKRRKMMKFLCFLSF